MGLVLLYIMCILMFPLINLGKNALYTAKHSILALTMA